MHNLTLKAFAVYFKILIACLLLCFKTSNFALVGMTHFQTYVIMCTNSRPPSLIISIIVSFYIFIYFVRIADKLKEFSQFVKFL